MMPPRQMQGRLTALSVHTTQGEWNFDVSAITGLAAAQPSMEVDAQPQATQLSACSGRPSIWPQVSSNLEILMLQYSRHSVHRGSRRNAPDMMRLHRILVASAEPSEKPN